MSTLSEKALMADPAPLGLAGFAFTTFLLSFTNAGWIPAASVGVVLPLAMAYGGLCQFLAGAFEMRKGNTFGFTAFCSYGAFWIFFALMVLLGGAGLIQTPAAGIGAALVLWGIFTLYMWVSAMTANASLGFTFMFLWITFFVLGGGALTGISILTKTGGYLGIITAIFAAYTSFAIVTNSVVGAGTMPLGRGISWKKAPRAN